MTSFPPPESVGSPPPVGPILGPRLGRWDGTRALTFFLVASVISLVLGVVAMTPLGFYGSVVLAEVFGFAILPWLVSGHFDTGWREWWSLRPVPTAFWIWSVLAVVAFAVTQSNLPVMFDRLYPMPPDQFEFYRRYLAADSVWELLVFMVVAAVIPGICEEITFRGMIQTGLRRSHGPKHAILWSGFLFALLHMNPWTFIGLWGFGCLLGYLVEKTGSIRPSILMHVLNNTLALVVFSVQSPDQWEHPLEYLPWYVVAPSGLVLIAALWQIHRLPIWEDRAPEPVQSTFND